ncbi:diaminopimelate decarboxylase [Gammaproteobacteria bacterium]|nr:diaminopimelate decarboxylase [Gammaproteobacteria bacterium]
MHKNMPLYLEKIELNALAKQYGTPLYAYSKLSIVEAFKSFDEAFGTRAHTICYATKANSNLAILQILLELGAGFDIVSGGELQRVLEAAKRSAHQGRHIFNPKKIIFSGVGKTYAEIKLALQAGIGCFNIEAFAEIDMINSMAAELDIRAPISLRVNPNVDAKTHPYISTGLKENKFGVPIEEALEIYQYAATLSHLDIIGLDCHIGSQLTEISPYNDALDKLLDLITILASANIFLKHLDIGGGIGIRYNDETLIDPKDWIDTIKSKMAQNQHAKNLEIIIEPGRALVGDAGVLLTTVTLTKENEGKYFAVVDAAMNDLIRPSLYDAWMRIVNTKPSNEIKRIYDVVGPICESTDFLGKNRELALKSEDVLAVLQAGAYSFSMSSNYNSRPRACEVLIDEDKAYIIRERESVESLFALEKELLV